ncbi:MAG: 50S ribosomal protein L23 [Proteobacteria bacterium]|nr:50S ribosomal protein L23 [Pseudomonadota bacterium]
MKRLEDVIRRPIINEKSTLLRGAGNQYVFEVDLRSNKQEITEAISTLFGVGVLSVNTSIVPGKSRRFGRYTGRRNKWKKAVVTLAQGHVIDFFDKPEETVEA